VTGRETKETTTVIVTLMNQMEAAPLAKKTIEKEKIERRREVGGSIENMREVREKIEIGTIDDQEVEGTREEDQKTGEETMEEDSDLILHPKIMS
jgi:hypothetical protein